MLAIKRQVGILFLCIAIISTFMFSLLLPLTAFTEVVLVGAYAPYCITMYVMGRLVGHWFLPEGEKTGLMEILLVAIAVFIPSLVISGVLFGTTSYCYYGYFNDRLFPFEPTLTQLGKAIVSGVFVGVIFFVNTAVLQIPLFLLGGTYFIRKANKGDYASCKV